MDQATLTPVPSEMFPSNLQQRDLCTALKRLYDDKELFDVTLVCCSKEKESSSGEGATGSSSEVKVEGGTGTARHTSYDCHKLVLVAASEYFRSLLLTNQFSTSEERNIIDLSPMSDDIVGKVLSFIYTGEINITDGTIEGLIEASIQLQLHNLLAECHRYMQHNVTMDNACMLHNLADDKLCFDMKRHTSLFIKEHFETLLTNGELNKLTNSNLCGILFNTDINVSSEDAILTSVLNWISANPVCSAKERSSLLGMVRFPHLSPQYIVEVVMDHDLMKQPPQSEYLKQAVKHQILPNAETLLPKKRSWMDAPAAPASEVAVIVDDKNGVFIFRSNAFDLESLNGMNQTPRCIDSGSSVCLAEENLVILGSQDQTMARRARLYNLLTGWEKRLEDSPIQHQQRVTVYMKPYVYTLGYCINGGRSGKFYRLNIKGSNKWEALPDVPQYVGDMIVLAREQDGKMFCMGGRSQSNSGPSSCAQMYDTKTDKWTQIRGTPERCDSRTSSGVLLNGKIIVLCPENCMTYDEQEDFWQMKRYQRVGNVIKAFVCNNHLYALTSDRCVEATRTSHGMFGETKAAAGHTLHQYDDTVHTWHKMTTDATALSRVMDVTVVKDNTSSASVPASGGTRAPSARPSATVGIPQGSTTSTTRNPATGSPSKTASVDWKNVQFFFKPISLTSPDKGAQKQQTKQL